MDAWGRQWRWWRDSRPSAEPLFVPHDSMFNTAAPYRQPTKTNTKKRVGVGAAAADLL